MRDLAGYPESQTIHIWRKFMLEALKLSMRMIGFFPWKGKYVYLEIPAACGFEVKTWGTIWLSTPSLQQKKEAWKDTHQKSWWAILGNVFPTFLHLHNSSVYNISFKFIYSACTWIHCSLSQDHLLISKYFTVLTILQWKCFETKTTEHLLFSFWFAKWIQW